MTKKLVGCDRKATVCVKGNQVRWIASIVSPIVSPSMEGVRRVRDSTDRRAVVRLEVRRRQVGKGRSCMEGDEGGLPYCD